MPRIPPEIAAATTVSLAAQEKLDQSTPALKHALTNSAAQGLPPIAIGPAQGQHLSLLCKMLDAKNVLEIGTLGGYSTLWFATSNPGVQVTSIEVSAKHREVALSNLQGQDNVDIILGAALDILPRLAKEGRVFDFVFIDADWEEQAQYFDWAVKLTRPRGCIYVDNAVRELVESQQEQNPMALIDAVAKDGRVQASLVPTMATHKETLEGITDGFLIATVLGK